MTTIKCEIDLENEKGLESVITDSLINSVKKEVQKKYEHLFKERAKDIALETIWQIQKKIVNLINEDIAITDRWGKPVFVGSVKDYIKKTIDEKLLRPVDKNGKTIQLVTPLIQVGLNGISKQN